MTAWHDWVPVAVRELNASLAKKGNTAAGMKAAEKKLGLKFPRRYREFVTKWNGGELRLRLLTLSEVVKNAKGRRGTEGDPLAELPEHLVPIAEEPHGIEVYCVSGQKQAGERVFRFDPEEPEKLQSYPDFEALMLEMISGSRFDAGRDGEYLKAIVAAHGIDWMADDPMAKWLPFEKCRAALPAVPKPQKQLNLELANWEPGVMGLRAKRFHSVTGHLARGVLGTLAPIDKALTRWTLTVGGANAADGTTHELTPAELGILASQVAKYVTRRRYENDREWGQLAAALTKASAPASRK